MEETNQEVTLKQLLQITIDQLGAIAVPASYTEQIAIPISRVISNLKVGIQAIDNVAAQASKEEPEPEIEVFDPETGETIKMGGEENE